MSKKQHGIIGLIVMLAFGIAIGPITALASKIEVVAVKATGYGPSKDTALRDALTNAIGQVNGLSVATAAEISQMQLSVSETSDLGQQESVTLQSVRSDATSTVIEGQIKSYEVIRVRKDPDDPMLYVAEVRAQINRLAERNDSNRKRLAIMPIKANIRFNGVYDYNQVSEVQRWLDTELENYLVQTRKFMVLSRADLPEVANEWALMNSSATPQIEKLKTGNLAGADYLVLPELLEAETKTESVYFQATGQTVRRSETKVSANIKVVDVITGEIKFSKSVTLESKAPQSERNMLDEMALQLVDHMVQQIYPSLIVSAPQKGVYVFNAGGDAIQVGDRYEVFQEGEAISDPYTGEVIGFAERRIGELEVTSVSDKFSYGRSIGGEEFGVGMLLRMMADNQANGSEKPQGPKTKGVRLPF